MIRIGLTGGIGSGKSTVATMLAERGAVIIDADQISRDLVEPGGEALAALVTEFGPRILQENGSLSRGELAALAFSEPQATARLNAIMHPLIREESARRLREAPQAPAVVYDMPLLVETGQQDLVDLVVVADVPEEVQLDRAVRLRGLDPVDVRRRMEVQASREVRLAAADVVIDNSGDLAQTQAQVSRLWDEIVGPDS
ncbi:MAG: dephospho-CoA kinase [Candidatus Nanopelagicales bacterium]|nr:dephospho-CoA kinase [Candidatus Nanopelagicales bacterium]MCF8536579.1 dephospho-CoA kinase [Candidatus Nanopelagicales bacterium]MCF8541612.1 dephospho-CoA kinase [Candidatus Nanopelagicales bacterium]